MTFIILLVDYFLFSFQLQLLLIFLNCNGYEYFLLSFFLDRKPNGRFWKD